MSRYIDAEKLYEKTAELEAEAREEVLKHDPKESSDEHISWLYWMGVLKERTAFKHDVAEAKTVDAVEVVRCKDCIFFPGGYFSDDRIMIETYMHCPNFKDDGFCSFGRRKKE